MHDHPAGLQNFDGTVRLFPLPNLVLFPHVVQPLHIFEPRYRQLMADALAGDRLITLALLQPGWEEDYHQRPPIHPVVCVGRIFQEEKLPDGRYNLLLQGLMRARVLEETPSDRLYRVATVERLNEIEIASASLQHTLRQQIGAGVRQYLSASGQGHEQLQKLLASSLPLGTLCDIFAFALPIAVEIKQELLEEIDIEARVDRFLAALTSARPVESPPAPARKFPPDFSVN
jgi:Lon protease-like protein